MTVSTLTNKVTYLGNGSATTFAVPFKVLDEDHLVVKRRLVSTNEIDHTYIGTDYSYSGIGDSSGTLTLDGAALSSSYRLEIERIVPYTQPLDIVNAGGFYPETVEEQLDLTTMQIQQIDAQSDDIATRALMVPVGDVAPTYADFAAAFQGDPGGNVMAVGTFLAASNMTIGAGIGAVYTTGLRTVGDGGAARYITNAAVVALVDAAWIAAHPWLGFISDDDIPYLLDFSQYLTDGMIGCTPDCNQDTFTGTDIIPFLNAVWDAYDYHIDFELIAKGPRIHFRDGDYKLGSEWEPRKIGALIGTCTGHSNFIGGTRFHSPVDTRAITINVNDSGEETKLAENAGTSEGFLLQGIQFISQGGTDTNVHAIWLRGRATIQDCIIGEYRNADLTKGKWPGNGIHIVANNGTADETYGNANNFRLRDNYIERVDGHGLFISGTDANAGSNIGLETRFCGGCGIFDMSGLGNAHSDYNIAGFANSSPLKGRVTHGGRHYQLIKATIITTEPGTDNNTWYDMGAAATWPAWSALTTYTPSIPILCLGDSNRSVFTGGYSEGGTSHVAAPGVAFAGQMGFTNTSSVIQQNQIGTINAITSPTGMGGGVQYLSGQPGYTAMGIRVYTIVGSINSAGITSGRALMEHRREAASGVSMFWEWSGEDMVCRYTGQQNYWRLAGPLTLKQFGTGAAKPYTLELVDPALADPADATKSRIIGMRSAAPVAGAHAAGEVMFNIAPTAGGFVGWVCVTAGTPGTWKTFGVISA